MPKEKKATKKMEKKPAQTAQQFHVQRIYLRDTSFEVPNPFAVFRGEWNPQTELEIQNKVNPLNANDTYEVILKILITAKSGDNVAFLLELQQAGIFTISGLEPEALKILLATKCPEILFPYARAAITDLVAKASLPQLILAPVNFNALYKHQAKQAKQAAANAE